jgi:hypothetical protein
MFPCFSRLAGKALDVSIDATCRISALATLAATGIPRFRFPSACARLGIGITAPPAASQSGEIPLSLRKRKEIRAHVLEQIRMIQNHRALALFFRSIHGFWRIVTRSARSHELI